MKILFVCLGNICRSPMAEGILKKKIREEKLSWKVESAGTSDYHSGENPDHRAILTSSMNDVDIGSLISMPFTPEMAEEFDVIITMDDQNFEDVRKIAGEENAHKIRKMSDFFPDDTYTEVPDPYLEGGFERVFRLLEESCENIVEEFK